MSHAKVLSECLLADGFRRCPVTVSWQTSRRFSPRRCKPTCKNLTSVAHGDPSGRDNGLPMEVSEQRECPRRASVNLNAVEILCIFCLQNISLICERVHHLLSYHYRLIVHHCFSMHKRLSCVPFRTKPCSMRSGTVDFSDHCTLEIPMVWGHKFWMQSFTTCNVYSPQLPAWTLTVRIRGSEGKNKGKPSIDSPHACMFWNINYVQLLSSGNSKS